MWASVSSRLANLFPMGFNNFICYVGKQICLFCHLELHAELRGTMASFKRTLLVPFIPSSPFVSWIFVKWLAMNPWSKFDFATIFQRRTKTLIICNFIKSIVTNMICNNFSLIQAQTVWCLFPAQVKDHPPVTAFSLPFSHHNRVK